MQTWRLGGRADGNACSGPRPCRRSSLDVAVRNSNFMPPLVHKDLLACITGLRGARPSSVAVCRATVTSAPTGEIESELGWPSDFEERFQLGRMIGQGSYGVVYEGYDAEKRSTCAVKILGKERKNCSRRKTLRRLQREAVLLSRCSGLPWVARLEAVYEKESYVYLVLECLQGGDLEHVVMNHGPLSESQAAVLIYECLKVLAACHANSVVHGDIKPANFMLVHDLSTLDLTYVRRQQGQQPLLKAIDFGCSQVLRDDKAGGLLTKRTGTPAYMSPEVIARSYGTPADMWSLGMMLYFMLAGRLPFWPTLAACRSCGVGEVMDVVCGDAQVPYDYGPWLGVSPDCHDFMRGLLTRDADARMTAQQALEHGWFYRFSR